MLVPICLALILVIADPVIVCSLRGQICQACPYFRIRMTEHTVPGPVIPVPNIPLFPCVVAGCSALIIAVLITSGVADLDRIRCREYLYVVLSQSIFLWCRLPARHVEFPVYH